MQDSRLLEVGVGLLVVAGLLALAVLALRVSSLDGLTGESYAVAAWFGDASGLRERAPVTVAGVRIGHVAHIGYDAKRFQAKVTLAIETRWNELPVDSMAAIVSTGLLGEKYVALQPGGAYDYLVDGSEIRLTQSAMVLEQVIGQFLFNSADDAPGAPPPLPEGDPFAQ